MLFQALKWNTKKEKNCVILITLKLRLVVSCVNDFETSTVVFATSSVSAYTIVSIIIFFAILSHGTLICETPTLKY
jgi:hypothetical protein